MMKINPNISSLSLDVFDTILLRNSKSELKRFYEISKIQYDILKNNKKDITPKEIFYSRIFSIKMLRDLNNSHGKKEEIKIKDIYSSMLDYLKIDERYMINSMLRLELNYELKNLRLNKRLINKIKYIYKNRKIDIYFISDMYLDVNSISFLINHFIKDIRFKEIYVSSEYGKIKSTGNLFKEFIKNEKINPRYHLHIGNDYIPDIIGSKKASMNSLYLQRNLSFKVKRRFDEIIFGINLKNDKLR